MKNDYPHIFAHFLEIEQRYYQKFFPELVAPKLSNTTSIEPNNFNSTDIKYRNISNNWLHITRRIDNNWKKKAIRLDNARNFVAHSSDMMKIAENLGYKGTNGAKHIRKECLNLLEQLLGIVPKP
jgi:hypothetical protein